jgi:hypothetical protein
MSLFNPRIIEDSNLIIVNGYYTILFMYYKDKTFSEISKIYDISNSYSINPWGYFKIMNIPERNLVFIADYAQYGTFAFLST